MDSVVADQMRGVIFGQAIGDALGFGTEWIPKCQVYKECYDNLSAIGCKVRVDKMEKLHSWAKEIALYN